MLLAKPYPAIIILGQRCSVSRRLLLLQAFCQHDSITLVTAIMTRVTTIIMIIEAMYALTF